MSEKKSFYLVSPLNKSVIKIPNDSGEMIQDRSTALPLGIIIPKDILVRWGLDCYLTFKVHRISSDAIINAQIEHAANLEQFIGSEDPEGPEAILSGNFAPWRGIWDWLKHNEEDPDIFLTKEGRGLESLWTRKSSGASYKMDQWMVIQDPDLGPLFYEKKWRN